MDPLLKTGEVSLMLGMKKSTLEAWRFYGKGPKFLKISRAVRYRLEDIQEFINESVKHSTSEYDNCRS